MQIVLSDEDLQKMPLNLRECLKALVFGDTYGELVKALGNQGDDERTDPLAIALDDATINELYNGINQAGRDILHIFAEKDGTVQAAEFMEALDLEDPRQLTGPLGGITRKLRSMSGADVSLWFYDKIYQVYLLPESHVYYLKRCFGLLLETKEDRQFEYEEIDKGREESEERVKQKAIREIRKKKEKARERYRSQIKRKYAEDDDLADLEDTDPSNNEKKGA